MYPITTMLLWPWLGVAAFGGAVARQHQFLAPDSAVGEGAAVAVPTRSKTNACATSKEEGQTYYPSGTVQELAALPRLESASNSSYTPRAYADFIPCPGLTALYNAGLLNPTLEGGRPLEAASAEEALMATVSEKALLAAFATWGASKGYRRTLVDMLIANGRKPFPLFRMTQFPDLRHWKGTFARYSATADGCRPTGVGFDEEKFDTMLASRDLDKNGRLSTGEFGTVCSHLGVSSPDGARMAHYVVFAGTPIPELDKLRLLYKGFFHSSVSAEGKNEENTIFQKVGLPQVLCDAFKLQMATLFFR